MIVDQSEAWHHNDSLLEILHGFLLFQTPHELYVLLCKNDQWSGMFCKVFDPNPENAAYTQETTDFCERGAVRPVQYLLNLLIFRVMTLAIAFVTNDDHLMNTKVHLPPGE